MQDRLINNGYIEVYCPNHPYSHRYGYVYEHRLIVETHIGRYLTNEEAVHHIDGNKVNNNITNLMLFKTDADHVRFHTTGLAIREGDHFVSPIIKYKIINCAYCGKEFMHFRDKKNTKYCCMNCFLSDANNDRPSKEELEKLIYEYSFVKIGEKYGVSDNAVRKWCKKYKLPYKYREIHPMQEKQRRFLLNDYSIKCIDEHGQEIIFQNIENLISFISPLCKTNNIKSIRSRISNAIKHNIKYLGFSFELAI